jgi:hypothetical protein
MKRNQGPYRESEPEPLIKPPWSLRLKRALCWFASGLPFAITPAMCAHLAGGFSWPWLVAPVVFVAAVMSWWTDDPDIIPTMLVVSAFLYGAMLIALGLALGLREQPEGCKEEVHEAKSMLDCGHKNHRAQTFVVADEVYVACQCER